MKALAWFCASALISAALHACLYSDCDCPPLPAEPEPQVDLPVREVVAWTAQGDYAELPITIGEAKLSVGAKQVVIHYEREGTLHEIVYTVIARQ